MENETTRGERRDQRRSARRKMRVVGRSVRLLQEIILRRARKLKKGAHQGS